MYNNNSFQSSTTIWFISIPDTASRFG